jgi:asparagine synthase (glutamine-hydrolysing)
LVNGDLVLVVDGRIDNRDDLRPELARLLRTDEPTDAELFLAAYQRWGDDCAEHIVGDFAFAVWDARKRRLFAARDAFAMRPFYYRIEPRRILFASEIKQILAAPDVPVGIFEPAIGAHLAVSALPGHTVYQGIEQIPPAHALVADQLGRRLWRYWEIDPEHRIEYADSDQYVEHFLSIFEQAVRSRLRSTKPVGLWLSGGLDSGSVAATAGRLRWESETGYPEIRTYSFAFEELSQCDERHISDEIAGQYKLPISYVAAEEHWPLKDYPAHGPDRDDPFLTHFHALLEATAGMASAAGVGSMLSGARGDLMIGEWIFDYPGLLRRGKWLALARQLSEHGTRMGDPIRKTVKIYLLQALKEMVWPPWRAPTLRKKLARSRRVYPGWINHEFAERVGLHDLVGGGRERPPVRGFARRRRHRAVFTPFQMQIAAYSGRMLATQGLGYADPWSDRRIAEFVLAVPQDVLNEAGDNKRLLRRAMVGTMPERARVAAGKVSPQPLFDLGIRDRGRSTVRELLRDPEMEGRGWVDRRTLMDHYRTIPDGGSGGLPLWHALTLEMWLRRFWGSS